MDTFFSFFILGVPGVLTYLIYNLMGDSTSRKQSKLELLAITSLLWVPTILCAIFLFNGMYFITNSMLTAVNIEYFKNFNITEVTTIEELMNNINNFFFIFFFTIIIMLSSLLVSLPAPKLYEKMITFFNWIRVKKGYARITPRGSSVWQQFFIIKNSNQKGNDVGEYPIVVQVSYLDDPINVIYGSLKVISNDGEQKKQFIIENEEEWTSFITEFKSEVNAKLPIGSVFFDASNKLVIKEINQVELNRMVGEWNDERQ